MLLISSKKFLKTFVTVLTFGLFMLSGISFVNAQLTTGTTTTGNDDGSGGQVFTNLSPNDGDVMGFAWMGQDIDEPNTPQGGGGWLKMNCKPGDCVDVNGNGTLDSNEGWGTNILIGHGGDDGMFLGEAWSSNYGWLTYEEDDVQECWQDNPYVTVQRTAMADIYGQGPQVPVVGWARFVNGIDDPNDDYDGCVSFSGLNHGVFLNLETGVVTGWAWGGPVVGWISFNNPACPFCNVSVSLPNTLDIDFWADDYIVSAGGGTTLNWQAINFPPDYVESCTASNTSGYGHWNTFFGGSGAVGPISTNQGNLPTGQHQINGINQQTTYALDCVTRGGDELPIKYVTINIDEQGGCTDPSATNYNPNATFNNGSCVYGPIAGCTDPLAVNYNPVATVDDGSCVGGGIPGCTDPAANNYSSVATYDDGSCTYGGPGGGGVNINLSATPSIIFTNNPSIPVTLSYQASSPSDIASNSCTGEATFNGSAINVSGWTNGTLANPNSQVSGINLSSWVSQDGDQFVFTINCEDDDGNAVSDSAVINVQQPVVPNDPPIVELFIDEPNNFPPSLLIEEIPLSGADPFTLRWNATRVNSCVANSVVYNNGIAGGANPDWDTSYSPESDNPNNNEKTFAIIDPTLIRNTIFEIECLPDNPSWNGGQPIRAQVCMNVSGLDFPQCSISGSGNIPSFEEI